MSTSSDPVKKRLLQGLGLLAVAGLVLLAYLTTRRGANADTAGPSTQEKEKSEAFHGLQFWADQRAYPGSEIPESSFYQSFQRSRTLAKRSARPISADTWKSLGPNNVGGRTIALAVDPRNANIVYAGSAGGGIWRMTLKGTTYAWERLETGFPVLGVNAVAIHPQNSRVLYLGTGEVYGYGKSIGGLNIRTTRGSYGIGILKSIDSGATWTKSLDWSGQQSRGVLCMRIHPSNPEIVLAGTSEGIYRSQDGGLTWQQTHTVLMAVDLAINPVNPSLVYASCGNLGSPGSGIYRSQDGGLTWQKLAGGLPASWSGKALLALYQAAPSTLYADVANEDSTLGLYRSMNDGTTWTKVNQGKANWAEYQGWFAHFVRVNPKDNSKIIAAGVETYFSDNGGTTLDTAPNPRPHLDHHCYADDPVNAEVVYMGGDGGVYRTTDGGKTWKGMSAGYVTSQFYNGFSSSPRTPNLAMGGLQDNSTVLYTGSLDWTWFFKTLGGDGTSTGIDPVDENMIYAAVQRLRINRSPDRGTTWHHISATIEDPHLTNDNIPPTTAFISPFRIAPAAPYTLYAGGLYLTRSDNKGSTWRKMNGGQPLNGNPILSLGVSPQDANTVYAATAPTATKRAEVFISTNGGTSFVNVTGTLPDRFYIDLVVSPRDSRTVYITLSGYGSSHVYRSENGGTEWIDIGQTLPDVPTSALAIDPENDRQLYAGNDLGVYVSVDYGRTWTEWKEAMPTAAMVMDLSISPSNRKIRSVTHGNGVFERTLLPASGVRLAMPSVRPGLGLAAVRSGIEFYLPDEGWITLDILNTQGQVVRGLASGHHAPGKHLAAWDGRDGSGRMVSAGAYLGRLRMGAQQKSLRIASPAKL